MKLTRSSLPTATALHMRVVLLHRRRQVLRLLAAEGLLQPVLFGSVARGDARGGSDFDLAVSGMSAEAFATLAHTRDRLREVLGADVAVSQVEALRPVVCRELERDGVPVERLRWRHLLYASPHTRGLDQ